MNLYSKVIHGLKTNSRADKTKSKHPANQN